MKTRILLFICTSILTAAGPENPIVERVGSTAFMQVRADSFNSLTPREKALAYWLTQAAIAIDPIIYDQQSRFGLRQKRILENVEAHPSGIAPAVSTRIDEFTKLFWANRGNHNETTAQKILPEFTFEQLRDAGLQAIKNGAPLGSASEFTKELDELRASLFDPVFEPLITAKSPQGGRDILQASANNFYSNVSLADLKGFQERYPLNSRLLKTSAGKLVEQVYRAGTPDARIAPGLYADYLRKANEYLTKAASVADPAQADVIRLLIRFYQTGDFQDWLQFGGAWVRNNPRVDFANGFIEVYRDARGAKGTSQAFVSITDERINALMTKIADHTQYFEDHAPWAAEFKKQGVKPPMAKAVETTVETGDFHVTTVGDNLPNENEVHQKYGSKSFLFTGSSRALDAATGYTALHEFASSPEEAANVRKYGTEAEGLMTGLHEIIGHGSGKLSAKLDHDAPFYLKEYFSTLEEARADLMALWNATDPKLREWGLISSPEVAKALYYNAARVALTQLRRIPKGDTIEEDHQRNRQLIVNYIIAKTGAIERFQKDGKDFIRIKSFEKMHEGVGMLLAELMRIKGDGDYAAIKSLIDQYGVHFDPKLRDAVVARYHKLNLPTYFAGITYELAASIGAGGDATNVTIS
ncbi:MAG: dipeptidyl peptidase 3 [Acidobacteriota bacterium]|nr:dipeptidyl peptidase 3 [Acidobacteriota bacterium]